MVHQVGKDSFKLDPEDLGWYTRYLAGVCGVKETRRRDQITDVLIHRSHLPLVPPEAQPSSIVLPSRPSHGSVEPPRPLRDYQTEAISFARGRAGAAFFHDLGLGKNYMAFPALDYPAVAVCPTSAIQVWEEEAQGYDLDVQVHRGHEPRASEISHEADGHLVTYGSASHWLPLFHGRGSSPRIRSLVIDEAHALHRRASRYHRALAQVRRDSTIVMTATPARNRLRSLHGLLHAIAPTAFGSLSEFRIRYCGATMDAWGHLQDGPELINMDELAGRLTEVAISESWLSPRVRHLRPLLIRDTIHAEIPFDDRVKLIEDSISRAFSGLRTAGHATASQIAYLTAQRVELGKRKGHWFMASGTLAQLLQRHHRLIIWCWHKEVLRPLAKHLRVVHGRAMDVITGEAPTAKRKKVIKEWQHGDPIEPRILLATLGSMSTAVNLTTAEAAVFLETSWAPLDLQQAEARHRRPGSHFDEVYSYYVVVPEMVDGRMTSVLLEKIEDVEAALGPCSQKDQMLALVGSHELEGIF